MRYYEQLWTDHPVSALRASTSQCLHTSHLTPTNNISVSLATFSSAYLIIGPYPPWSESPSFMPFQIKSFRPQENQVCPWGSWTPAELGYLLWLCYLETTTGNALPIPAPSQDFNLVALTQAFSQRAYSLESISCTSYSSVSASWASTPVPSLYGLLKPIALSFWCLHIEGFLPWWVTLPSGLPTMGLAICKATSEACASLRNSRDFSLLYVPNLGWYSCSFTRLAFPQHSCFLGPSPCTCCSRGFALPWLLLSCTSPKL